MDETVICYASGWLIGSWAGNEITYVIAGCLLSLKVQQALVSWQQRSIHPLELDESQNDEGVFWRLISVASAKPNGVEKAALSGSFSDFIKPIECSSVRPLLQQLLEVFLTFIF